MEFIDLKSQASILKDEINNRISNVLNHGSYIMGPEVQELEELLAEYTNSSHCITVASGTEALLISLMALDIKKGDEVITSPFTFISTAEVIRLLGATPVYVDIDRDTCNISYQKITSKITDKTKVIMPVSLYGQASDMNPINEIASQHNIVVIEDAAQSFGATYKGKKSCNLSDIGCTSFFPSKPLGCYGDGGAIFTNSDDLAIAFREIRVHGQSKRYYHTRIGVGGRMDTLQCAILLAKLQIFDREVEQRINIGNRYKMLIEHYDKDHLIDLIKVSENSTSVWAQYTVRVPNRDYVMNAMNAEGIPTAVHYPTPLFNQPAYLDSNAKRDCTVSIEQSKKVMSLPMSPYLSEADQDKIVHSLLNSVYKSS